MKTSLIVQLTKESPVDALQKLSNLLKKYRHLHFNLIVPLSFLEKAQMSDIDTLLEEDRVNFINICAYATNSNALDDNTLQEEIMLNEYALGYFFGSRKSFDGEDVMMIKDLIAFTAPDLSISTALTSAAADLGYSIILVSGDTQLGIYPNKQNTIRVISVGKTDQFQMLHIKYEDQDSLTQLTVLTTNNEKFVLIGELTDYISPSSVDMYTKFNIEEKEMVSSSSSIPVIKGFETIAIWDDVELEKIDDENARDSVRSFIETHRSLS